MKMILPALLGAALALAPHVVHAQPAARTPFTVDDLLRLEALGQAVVSPDETLAVFERLGPVEDLPVHEHDHWDRVLRSEVMIAPDLDTGDARRLLPAEEGAGHVIGPWSPDGRRIVLYRLRDRKFSVGVAEPTTGAVRWSAFTPELAFWGRGAIWRSPDELLVLATDDPLAPRLLKSGWIASERLPHLWEKSRRGDEAARTVVGAGRFADLTPEAPNGRLIAVDAVSGAERTLAEGRFYDMELSPDGRYLALASFAEELGFDPDQPFLQGDFSERRALAILDLETGALWRPAPDETLSPHLLSWSPDGDELLAFLRPAQRTAADGRLVRFRPSDRQSETVPLKAYSPAVSESGLRTPVVSADWLGATPVLFAQDASGRRDWIALGADGPKVLTASLERPTSRLLAVTRDRIVVSAQDRAFSIGLSGPPLDLGEPIDQAFVESAMVFNRGQRFAFTGAPRQDWLAVRRGDAVQRVRVETGAPVGRPAPMADGVRALGETKILAVAEDGDGVRRLVVSNGTTLAHINGALAHRMAVEPRAIVHAGAAGQALTSWLYTPAGRPDAPLIIIPYPGGSISPPAPDDANPVTNVHLMTAQGYAVLLPDLSDVGRPPDPAAGIADAVLRAVDAAAASGGFDPTRLILWGHSFGGFSVMAAATQSDRFSAVIAANGAYDLASSWGTFPLAKSVAPELGLSIRSNAGIMETGQFGLGGPPWALPQAFIANSPLFAADRIRAPVLLVAGDRDYIPPGQAEEMFSALYRQGKDAVLVTYRGEGHVLASPGNIRDYHRTIWTWLDQVIDPRPVHAARPEPSSPSAPAS